MGILDKVGLNDELKGKVMRLREEYPVEEMLLERIPKPEQLYFGEEVWKQAVTAILCGSNILLVGEKATGKNIFAENLAAAFNRPRWDVSFHIKLDADSLVGMDTFKNGEVTFRPGPVYQAARYGGFAVLDEINMARSEAVAVLHAALDFRRSMDVPGYERILLHPMTRFIATMNYGYSGTKELNQALVSRFAVIDMPMISGDNLRLLIKGKFTDITDKGADELSELFIDLVKKGENGEISLRALDLRGFLDAISFMENGLDIYTALDMGITNKSFDIYEQTLIRDTIRARISKKLSKREIFKV